MSGDIRSGRFVVIPARAIDDTRLGSAALRVLCALGTYGDRDGRCFPALPTIARRLEISKQAVSKQLHELQELGYLEIVARTRPDGSTSSNAYRLVFDAELAAVYDRLGDESEGPLGRQLDVDGGKPGVDLGQPGVGGPSTSEVDPIDERPTRTKNISRHALTEGQFLAFKAAYPKRKGGQGWPKARELLAKAVKSGVDLGAIILGASAYAATVARKTGDEREFIKQARTWLSERGWEDDYGTDSGGGADGGRPLSPAEKAAFREKHGLQAAGRSEVMAAVRAAGLEFRWREGE